MKWNIERDTYFIFMHAGIMSIQFVHLAFCDIYYYKKMEIIIKKKKIYVLKKKIDVKVVNYKF